MTQLQAGDCVNLVSGGCLMTVRCISGNDAECDWFDGNQQLRWGVFRVSQIAEMDSLMGQVPTNGGVLVQ